MLLVGTIAAQILLVEVGIHFSMQSLICVALVMGTVSD
jgi:hypothetical protein